MQNLCKTYKNKNPFGWFGFDVSIDFGQIIEDIFG